MRPSALPETTPVPSALKAAAVTGSECDAIVRRHLPVATSQILTFSSKEPLTYWTAWDARKGRAAGQDVSTSARDVIVTYVVFAHTTRL